MPPTKFVYCHGLPGSAAELGLFAPDDASRADVVCLDRLTGDAHELWQERLLAGFDAALARLDRAPVRVIAFSLGAMSALHIAARRPEAVESLDLISAAAPLELGDFLPRMAGRAVFQAAAKGAAPLRRLSHVQSLMNTIAPSLLSQVMFAGASAPERALIADPRFCAMVRDGLNAGLGRGRAAYEDELRTYVRPWREILSSVCCPVTLWHGDEDCWAPLDMAQALAAALPPGCAVKAIAGVGHYGALRAALPAILAPN